MSFSSEFQQEVDRRFTLERVVPVANWPMFASSMLIWRAKTGVVA
jgi:hypothetical protein